MKLKLFVYAAIIALLTACNTEQKKLQQKINQTEASADKTNIETATALAQLYEEYAEKFKDDEKAPIYLFKAAELYQNTGTYAKSIEMFTRFAHRYPDNEMAGDAMFYIGFIYENMLGDAKQAKAAYKEFLAVYPNHKMAESTKQNLPYVGKMPEWTKQLDSTGNSSEIEPRDTLAQEKTQ